MTEKGIDDLYEKKMSGYLDRLCSLKLFMKELKERFSRWFNKRHGRRGTLWRDRYRSVLVEDGEALQTMAAYLDLNPLRAGLVSDPKDYRWCGYAETMAGSRREVGGRASGCAGCLGCRWICGMRSEARLIAGCSRVMELRRAWRRRRGRRAGALLCGRGLIVNGRWKSCGREEAESG